tara:strand:- start:133 stop:384 length:252 start_codon:yes stop_codon:yes gene_type:complete
LSDLKEKYLIKSNSYMIDLESVDFITWKENEKNAGTYWAKLHIGSKEARYICDDVNELKDLLEQWSLIKGKKIEIEENEIIGW